MPLSFFGSGGSRTLSNPKPSFQRYAKKGRLGFEKSLKGLSYGDRKKAKELMQDKFSGGKKLSHDRILETVEKEFGNNSSMKKKIKKALTPEAKTLTKEQKRGNINYTRQQRLMDEDQGGMFGKLIRRRAKVSREDRIKERTSERVEKFSGKPEETKTDKLKGPTIGFGGQLGRQDSNKPPVEPPTPF